MGFDRFERENLYYPVQNPKTGRWYPCDPNLVWRYASELIETDIEGLETETMEEWIRQDKIIFPDPAEEKVVVWNTMDELLAAIKANDVPVTPKKKNPLITGNIPNLEFWLNKPVGFGRPGFKKHWQDLRSHTNPVSSWISRMAEDANEDDFTTLRSREAGEGTGVIEKIFGRKAFSYPKPPSLMKQLVAQATEEDSIVLDFFAGSGTTAQAVLEQNVEDDGKRRFIMVSSTEANIEEPDKNICRDVCAVRLKAIIDGFGGNAPTGGDFAYLRTHRIPAGRVLEIDHAQVWTALQLMHRDTLAPFERGKFCWAGDEDEAVMYLPRFRREDAPLLRKQVKHSAAVVLYSWQPRAVAQHLRALHVTHHSVSDTLTRRFGLNLKLTTA